MEKEKLISLSSTTSSIDDLSAMKSLQFSKDAEFRPGSRATFVSVKVAKTIDAPPVLSDGTDAKFWKACKLAVLKQGTPIVKSVLPWGRAAGVGPREWTNSLAHVKEPRMIYSL